MSNVIDTVNLTKMYGEQRGIIDLSLKIEEGDFFGYIGPNGAGKSTTIRLLVGLAKPTRGKALIFGKDINTERTKVLKDIGYIPAETMFYQDMTVEEVLMMSAELHKTDCTKEMNRLCERFDLDPKKNANELSTGNRRKVSIINALQTNPRLCIMDEPTSGLDPLIQREFFNELEERNAKGMTIFFSSHVLADVSKHCKNAAIIKEGQIIKNASVSSLLKGSAKRVMIYGVSKAPDLANLKDVVIDKNSVSFLYSGEMPKLIVSLLGMPIIDLQIIEPDLGEIFMHYYNK